jgi:hypothetical protein
MKATVTRVIINGVLQNSGAFSVGTGAGRLVAGNLGVGVVLQLQIANGVGDYCPVVRNGVAWELTPTNNSIELTTPGVYRLVSTGAAVGGTVQATYFEENKPGLVRVERLARDAVAAAASVLGLGTMAFQNASAVAITGGTVSGLTSLGVVGTTVLENAGTALRVVRTGGDRMRVTPGAAGTGVVVDSVDAAEGAYAPYVVQASQITLQPVGGDIQFLRALIGLGGGAAPTLGTIGGAGPATAGQHSWARFLDDAGAAFWVPVWK